MSRVARRPQRILSGIVATTALATPTYSQPPEGHVPPVFESIDENGVDQISGQLVQTMTSIAIGPGGPGSLRYNWTNSTAAQTELFGFVLAGTPTADKYSVSVGGATDTFTYSGGSFTQDQGRSSTLVWDAGTQHYVYTRTDGAVAIFGNVAPSGPPSTPSILSLTYPAGQSLTYYYRMMPPITGFPNGFPLTRSVISNLGYQLHYDYTLQGDGLYHFTKVVLFNRAIEACDPNADTCALAGNWPSLSFTEPVANEVDATDNLGRVFRWTTTARPPQFPQPGTAGTSTLIFPTGRTLTYAINANGQVESASDGRGTWRYTHPSPSGGNSLTFFPEQNGPPRNVNFDTSTGRILSENTTLPTGNVITSYTWTNNRVSAVSVTGGPTIQYTYDSRGNLTQTRRISATPGTPPDSITSAVYPAICTNPRTCNLPTSTTDALGGTTDYTYDPNTGAVLSVTLPAGANGIRPQTLYGYAAFQAYYLNGVGSIAASGSNVTLPVSVSSCMTQGPGVCQGGADEMRTTIAYGPQSPGVANNLLPVSRTSSNGTGTLTATTAMTYTPNGDVETVDGPSLGTADTVRTYYDAARQAIGVVGADPDAGGPLLRRATRTTYNGDGQPTAVEIGTATDQSASGLATFVSAQQQVTGYDAQGRATSVRLNSGGATYALTQTSTTLSGFPECLAVRMNAATFATPPGSACTPATVGPDGPDRISRIAYDGYRRLPVTVTTAVGTELEAVERSTAYTPLNQVESVVDGMNNRTSYTYDGLGRLLQTRYPPSAQGTGSSNPGDYEQFTYATATVGGATVSTPLVASRRLRDGTSINYTYDNLGRVTGRTMPTGPWFNLGRSFTYDNQGRVTSANGNGTFNYNYDALGRMISETNFLGTTSYQYDVAGRRTRMAWPDGFYVDYDYDVTGQMLHIRENGAVSGPGVLATYAWDNLGRRTSLTRGNGTVTSYTYDAASRLTQLVQDLSGTGYDQTVTLNYNAGAQIRDRTGSNEAYAYNGFYNVNRGYTTNGMNQHTVAGPANFTYDNRGNLISDGTNSYEYTAENALATRLGPSYQEMMGDSLDRLFRYYDGVGNRWFLYDGQAMIAETNVGGTAIGRRYVHGPGTDEPIVWYEIGDTTPRRWLHADERGSIVALTNDLGQAIGINTYDESGTPNPVNNGRFQFTGQVWLAEAGLYYYRARMYSPTLGRFMQTDPIGYEAGMNMYNYVRGDPVNLSDPMGLQCQNGVDLYWTHMVFHGESRTFDPSMSFSIPLGCFSIPTAYQPDLGASQFGPNFNNSMLHLLSNNLPSTRGLSRREKALFACNGISQDVLDRITLHDSMMGRGLAFLTRINPNFNAAAITLHDDIFYRSGYPGNIFSNAETMRTLAEEVGHVNQYAHGMTTASYAWDVTTSGGYENSHYENEAKAFANSVVNNFRSGRCRPQ